MPLERSAQWPLPGAGSFGDPCVVLDMLEAGKYFRVFGRLGFLETSDQCYCWRAGVLGARAARFNQVDCFLGGLLKTPCRKRVGEEILD